MPPKLAAVHSRPGVALYEVAKLHLREAIAGGLFQPGQRLPSTQELAKQLSVSLVTMHRALKELEEAGVLRRVQGNGTFVTEGGAGTLQKLRVSLAVQNTASFADYYHNRILEGITSAARESGVEVIIVPLNETPPQRCDGHLLLNPTAAQAERFLARAGSKPSIAIGAQLTNMGWIDIDNNDMVIRAINHLYMLGHRHIGFVGGDDETSNSRDRYKAFADHCAKWPEITPCPLKTESWQLTEKEVPKLQEILQRKRRPTAIIAGGYYLALEIYRVAASARLAIPTDLSLVGVDDPPSAGYLSPPLTTLRQPLSLTGQTALLRLREMVQNPGLRLRLVFQAELIARGSTARLS